MDFGKTFWACFLAIMAALFVQWLFGGLFSSISADKKMTSDLNRIINEGKSREQLAHDAAMDRSDQMQPTTVEEEKKRRAEIERQHGLNPDKN